MATAQLITADNWGGLLKRSSQGRAGTPDGNIFFDTANDTIEIITAEELASLDLGSGAEANPLTNADKIQVLALYFFSLQEVEADPALQNFRTAVDAVGNRMGRLVGAGAFLNGITLATGGSLGDDRLKIADSGFTEFAAGNGGNTLIDRVYHGAKSLNTIQATSQPFYMLAASLSEAHRQAATPVDFSKPGGVNEAIQTFGTTANGDAGAGDVDNRNAVLILGVRTFGNTIGEATSSGVGASELGAYLQGYPLGESPVQALSGIDAADVWGASQVSPYTGLSFTRLASPRTETGFNEGDAEFTDIIVNSAGASLIQVRAWMDMLMQQDSDQNANSGVTGAFRPKRAEALYTIDATGKLVTRKGIFIEGIPAADEQTVIFTANDGTTRTRPFNVGVVVFLSAAWFADTSPWFRLLYEDGAAGADFNTAAAVTATDANGVALAGDKTDARIYAVSGGYELRFSYAYDTNTEAGLSAGVDKAMALQVGGINNTKRRTVLFTIIRAAQINVDATTEAETN